MLKMKFELCTFIADDGSEGERALYVMAYANTVNVRETVKIRDEDEVAEVEDWAGAGGRTSSRYSNSS